MTIARATYTVVPIDGVLADFRAFFHLAAQAFVSRRFTMEPALPPHTFETLARACGLHDEEQRRIYNALRGMSDLWTRLAPLEEGRKWLERDDVVLYAERFPTPGKDVLIQTSLWLLRHYPQEMEKHRPALHVRIVEPFIKPSAPPS